MLLEALKAFKLGTLNVHIQKVRTNCVYFDNIIQSRCFHDDLAHDMNIWMSNQMMLEW